MRSPDGFLLIKIEKAAYMSQSLMWFIVRTERNVVWFDSRLVKYDLRFRLLSETYL